MQKLFFLLLGLQTATHSMEGESKAQITSPISYQSISSKELGMQELKEGDRFQNHASKEARGFVRHHVVLNLTEETNDEDVKTLHFNAHSLQNNAIGSLKICLPKKNSKAEIYGKKDEIYIQNVQAKKGYGLSILNTFINFFKKEEVFPGRRYFSLVNTQAQVRNDWGKRVLLYDVIGFQTIHNIKCFNGNENNNHNNEKIQIDGVGFLPAGSCENPYMYLSRSAL
jgi:hypothetical protein